MLDGLTGYIEYKKFNTNEDWQISQLFLKDGTIDR